MLARKAYRIILALGICLFVTFYFFRFSPVSVAVTGNINWQTYDKGIELGKNEEKKIFLHFYANWCFYCRKMAQETFQDPTVIEYLNRNYIPIRIDTDQDKRTAALYNVRALPSTWFLTNKGEKIGDVPGYISSKQMIELLRRLTTEKNGAPGQV